MNPSNRTIAIQDPIVDQLYSRCCEFLIACDKRDYQAKRRLLGTIQEFWYQRWMAGDRLPMPPIPKDQALHSDDFYIDQAVQWVSALTKKLEVRRNARYS